MNTHISKQLTCALLAITLLCAGITVRGQQLRWNWATQATGSLDNHICATICDTAGNIFLSGSYVDTLHFGALSIPPYGGQDIFIAKFDPHGTPIWMESAGGRADDYPTAMTISNSGDIIIAGICGKDTKFNNEPSSRHKTNFFFSVYAPDGKFKWSQAFQASRSDYIKAITVGPGGQIYFAGYFSKPFDFIGTQVEPSSAINAMVGCLDSLGSPEWIQPFTCEYGENRITALCHRNNEFWLAGSCNAPTRIGETVISPAIDGTLALFVASFDEAGNVSNIATPLFSPDAEITSMTTTDNGLLVLGGNFNDRLFFNRPPNPPGEIINGLPPIGELFPEENILGLSSFSSHGNLEMFLAAITS